MPRFTSDLHRTRRENATIYHQVTAVDDDPDDRILSFDVVGGPDADKIYFFSDGSASLAVNADYENPKDANGDNIYEIEIRVNSGPSGGPADGQATATFSIEVTDVDNEAPGAPRNFARTKELADNIELTWTKPGNSGPPITGYRVETLEDTPDSTARTAIAPPGFDAYYAAGLTPGKAYQIRIAAFNDEGTGPWTAWIEASTDDCAAATTTGCGLQVGVAATGTINYHDTAPDADWYKVSLTSGESYVIDAKGSEASDTGGTLADPEFALYDSAGSAVADTGDNDSGAGLNARGSFAAPSTGDFYIAVTEHGGDDTGTYTISIREEQMPRFTTNLQRTRLENSSALSQLTAVDDDPGDVILGFEAVGGADRDKFYLQTGDGVVGLINPPDYERPTDANGDNVYEIEIRVNSGPSGGPADGYAIATLTFEVTDDDTEAPGRPRNFAITKEQTDQIEMTWTAPSNRGPSLTSYEVRIAQNQPVLSWQTTTIGPSATSYTQPSLAAGTEYLVQIRAINPEGQGPWSPQRTVYTDDCAAATTTGCAVQIGSTATGRINTHDTAPDADWFEVALTSGQSYVIDVKGSEATDTGGTLGDPEFEILDSTGTAIANSGDNDSGAGLNAQATFTPTSTATYYIKVTEHGGDDTGTYTIAIAEN